MQNHCEYVFLTGTKKNTKCDSFIRGKGKDGSNSFCYQHKPKIVKPKEAFAPASLTNGSKAVGQGEVKAESQMSPIKRKGKPVKINPNEDEIKEQKSQK